MNGDTRGSRRLLPAHPSSVPDARRTIRAWLTDGGFADVADEAEQAVSEVVTNAIVHTGKPVELSARMDVGRVRVEVVDGSPHLPQTRDFDIVSGTGRGLKLLDHVVTRWGSEPRGEGKVVWFEVGHEAQPAADSPEPVAAVAVADDVVHIELLDVPLLLMAAWLDHSGALLRDCLLFELDLNGADDTGALQRHATASELLALVADQLPRLPEPLARDEVMAGATEPLVTQPRVQLDVPRELVARFPVMDATLDRARELAWSGALLTPPTQPELQELRYWLTGEVARQAVGGSPRPWVSSMSTRPALEVGALLWDASVVEEATTAVVAIDDYDVIVAASRPALELLGQPRGSLVGRRTLALIPPRYRQAHLAGFTLHRLNGRGPMLEGPVTVPMLQADGTELPVELTITSQSLPGDRAVFFGAFRLVEPDDS